MFNATELVLKILSCIVRAEEKYGAYLIASCLCGAKSKRIKEFELDKLSTYGIIDNLSIAQVKAVILYLIHKGLILRSVKYGSLKLTNQGKKFLKTRPSFKIPQEIINKAKSSIFPKKLTQTHFETFKLWQRGLSVSEIADLRKMNISTIGNHLADLIYHGRIDNISHLVSKKTEQKITNVLERNKNAKLKTIKEQLPKEISYDQIKIIIAHQKKGKK